MPKHKVYVLSASDTGEVRYVGKTSQDLKARLRIHLNDSVRLKKKAYRNNWIRSVVDRGGSIVAQSIGEFWEESDALLAEIYYIAFFRENGLRLVNQTDGGEGVTGYVPTPEHRAKMRLARVGRTPSLGMRHTPEAKEKSRLASTGRHFSESALIRRARSLGGRDFVDENGILYQTCPQAAKALGVFATSVCAVLRGRLKTTGGHTFKYVDAICA